MSNSYLSNAASIAGAGIERGLEVSEIVDALDAARYAKERAAGRAMDGNDRRAAAEFDMAAAGVPPELGGFGYGNGGEDIEFGVDQADWQVAQADDKDIEARNRKRAILAADDIGFDARMREQGDGARERRAQAMMELREARAEYDNPYGRTDFRMQHGERIVEDPWLVGARNRDGNLFDEPKQERRIFAKFGRDGKVARGKDGNPILPHKRILEREPEFPLGFEDPTARNKRMIREIRRERAEANILREASPRVNIAPNSDGGFIDPVGIGNLQRLGDIKDVGNLKVKLPAKAGGFNEGQYFPVAAQDGIAPAFNASGIPLGVQGPVAANLPDANNVLNAPRDVRQWAIQNAPSFKEGGRVFGDFPQVDIGGAGNDFLARIAKIKANKEAFDPGISAIRNIEDLEGVVGRFGAFAEQGGLKMFALDADNKEVHRDQVGLPEIFQKMKMNENAQGRLANAIFQLEAGKANGVNQEQRAFFEAGLDQFGQRSAFADVFEPNLVNGVSGVREQRIPQAQVQFGARLPEFGNDEAQLQKIPRGAIQVGVDAVGNPIQQDKIAALQALQGNQAQPPLDANELRDARNGLVGLVQGEGRGRNYGFAKPIPEGVDPMAFFKAQAVARAKPGKQPDFARVRENVNRRQAIIDREIAARNAPNQVLGVVGSAEKELQAKGANFPVPPMQGIGEVVPENWRRNPDLVQLPEKVIMSPEEIAKRKNFGRTVVAQAEGGGMGGGNRPTAVAASPAPDPWQTPPATGPGITEEVQRRMPASMPNELAELNSGPTQGPRTPGIRQKIMNSIKRAPTNFVQAPRRQRWGAVGGGALLGAAGISSLINNESERRQEEQY